MEKKWFSVYDKTPENDKTVVVYFRDGSYALAKINENYYRKAWMVRGSNGLFYRHMIGATIDFWRDLTEKDLERIEEDYKDVKK